MRIPLEETAGNSLKKQALLRAPLSRVWRALSDAREFGAWFRVALDSEFVEGAHVRGRITYPGYEHLTSEFFIERITPPTYLAFRWHPAAVDPNVDYSKEPMTLVEFELTETVDGTKLVITESGFDQLPASRRAEAFRMNEQGWASQLDNVSRYVTRN